MGMGLERARGMRVRVEAAGGDGGVDMVAEVGVEVEAGMVEGAVPGIDTGRVQP